MNKNIHNNQDIDDLFKNAFEDFQQLPTKNLWGNIQEKLETKEVDQVFYDALKGYEREPSDKVWLAVKRHIPLSLALRNQLRYLSRVAAVLVFIMLVTIYFTNKNNNQHSIIANVEETKTESNNFYNEYKASVYKELAYVERQTIAYYDIKQQNIINEAQKVYIKEIKEKAIFDIEEPTLADLFDVDLEPLNINDEKIKQILEPLEKLPLDAAFALAVEGEEESLEERTEEVFKEIREVERIPDINIAVYPILKVADDVQIEMILEENN